MKLAQTSALIICLLGAPGVSLAADAKEDVEKAYAAWDAAFNKQDEKAIGATYVATAKLMPPTHQVASGPAEIEEFFGKRSFLRTYAVERGDGMRCPP
ncbi:hypothetical protein ACVIW2_000103 [Bradyrhizobium huanghuaihaiense]